MSSSHTLTTEKSSYYLSWMLKLIVCRNTFLLPASRVTSIIDTSVSSQSDRMKIVIKMCFLSLICLFLLFTFATRRYCQNFNLDNINGKVKMNMIFQKHLFVLIISTIQPQEEQKSYLTIEIFVRLIQSQQI